MSETTPMRIANLTLALEDANASANSFRSSANRLRQLQKHKSTVNTLEVHLERLLFLYSIAIQELARLRESVGADEPADHS